MAEKDLTKEQLAFLDECNSEFSERYTDADLDYKKIYDSGIPSPPIMHPWYGKVRYGNRDRGGRGGRYNDFRNRNQHYRNDDRNQDYRHRDGAGSSYNEHNRDRYRNNSADNRDFKERNRYRPY